MAMREHLLLGSEQGNTIRSGCGMKPVKMNDGYVLGCGTVVPEKEYVVLRQCTVVHMCARCESAWRKICRARGQKWTETARARRPPDQGKG